MSKSESSDTLSTSVTQEVTTTASNGSVTTTIQEVRTTTTTKTSTSVTSITHENGSKTNNLSGTVVPRVVIIDNNKQEENLPQETDAKTDKSNNNNTESDKVTTIKISEALPANSESSKSGDKKLVFLSNSQDGKPNTTIMNIQSVCPNSKATILKTGEKITNDTKGATVVVLNKDGGQVKFTVAGKVKPGETNEEKTENEKTEDKVEVEDGQGIIVH